MMDSHRVYTGEENESQSQDIQQQTSTTRCSKIGVFIDESPVIRWIFKPSRFDIIPYIHVVIVVIAHVLLYGGVSHWIANTPEYLRHTLLDAVLSSNETLRSIKVASVSIGVILFFDLLVDIVQSMIGYYYKAEETGQQMIFRAKEWTVRTLFILSLVEPACVMLIVPPEPTNVSVIFAYCSAFAKNITFVCMGVFCLSNTFDKTPKEYLRSVLLSFSFTSGQIFMHYAAMTDPSVAMVTLSQVGLLLSCLPLVFYFYNCMYFLRQIWLKTRREGGFSNVSLREYTFLAYAVATCLGIVITLIVVFGFNGLYYYNSSLTDLELYDLSIMCYAILATIVPARIARIEAKQACKRVIVTKKNVSEKLSYPLLEVYLGLDKLLHTDNVVEHLQPAEMLRLSQLTLTCNEALHCLEGIVSMDSNERQTLESDSSGEKEGTTGTLGYKHFSARVMSSIVASCFNPNGCPEIHPQDSTNTLPPPPPDRFFPTPRNEVTSSEQRRSSHPTVTMPTQRHEGSVFSRHDSVREHEEQELISILSNSVFSDPPINKQRNSSSDDSGSKDKASPDVAPPDSQIQQLQILRPHINMFGDVDVHEVVMATDTGRKSELRSKQNNRGQGQGSSTTTIRFDPSTYDEKEVEAGDAPQTRLPARRFGGAHIRSSRTLMQTALGRSSFLASVRSNNRRLQHRMNMAALPPIPDDNEEFTASARSSQKSEQHQPVMVVEEDVDEEEGNDGLEVLSSFVDHLPPPITSVVAPRNEEQATWEVEPVTNTTAFERGTLPLPDSIILQLNMGGRRWAMSEATSDDKSSLDCSAISISDTAPSYTYDYTPMKEDAQCEDLPPRVPQSSKISALQLYSKLPSTQMVRTRYSQLDGTNPQLLELVAGDVGQRYREDACSLMGGLAQRRAYVRSVSSSVALGFVPIGSATGLSCDTVDMDHVRRDTKGDDPIALFTWRLLMVVRADLRAAIELFDLQMSLLSDESAAALSYDDKLREAFLLKCAQWKSTEEDGMVELRAHLNVVQTMVLKAAVSLSVTLDCVLLSDAADRDGQLDSGERDQGRPLSFSPPESFCS